MGVYHPKWPFLCKGELLPENIYKTNFVADPSRAYLQSSGRADTHWHVFYPANGTLAIIATMASPDGYAAMPGDM